MFTTDTTDFSQTECDILNEVLAELLSDVPDDMYNDYEKTYSGDLNNAWHHGITVEQLRSAVGLKGRG